MSESTLVRTSHAAARRAQRPTAIEPHQLYSLHPETSAALDMSRASVYALVKLGKLRVVKLDDRMRVPGSEIIRLTTPSAA